MTTRTAPSSMPHQRASDVLVPAIDIIRASSLGRSTFDPDAPIGMRLGCLTRAAGLAIVFPRTRAEDLTVAANYAVCWAQDLNGRANLLIWDSVRAEYDRAHAKHDGMTPYHPSMSDDDRAAILVEEVGEVARALTPDSHTPTDHGGDLVDELVQIATTATAWIAHILADAAAAADAEED